MLHLFLFILKIIGIILAALLGLLLLILLVLLFVPIRPLPWAAYQREGTGDNGEGNLAAAYGKCPH